MRNRLRNAVLLLVALTLVAGGCGARRAVSANPSATRSDADRLEAAHLFALPLRTLALSGRTGLRGAPSIPDPLSNGFTGCAANVGEYDLAATRRGLSDRLETGLASYRRKVIAREEQSAEITARVATEESTRKLDEKLAAMKIEMDRGVLNVRLQNAAQIRRLRLEIAVLTGNLRVLAGAPESETAKKLATKRTELKNLETAADSDVASVQEKYRSQVSAARQAAAAEIAEIERREDSEARDRADRQVAEREQEAQRTLEEFMAALARHSAARTPPIWDKSTARRASGGDTGRAALSDIDRTARVIGDKMIADVRTAAVVAGETQRAPGLLLPNRNVTREAEKLLHPR